MLKKSNSYSKLLAAFIISFPFFIILIQFPFQIVFNNNQEFLDISSILSPFIFSYFICYLTILIFSFIFSKQLETKFSISLFLIGLYFLLSDGFVPLDTGVMITNIKTTDLGFSISQLSGEIFLILSLLVIFFKGDHKYLYTLAIMISISLTIFAGYQYIDKYLYSIKVKSVVKERETLFKPPNNTKGNVYHFVFDGFPGDRFEDVLNENKIPQQKFNGFTYFPKNRSNFLNTAGSKTTFHTGNFPKEMSSLTNWEKTKSQGILNSFHDKGYNVYEYVINEQMQMINTTGNIDQKIPLTVNVDLTTISHSNLLDLSILRAIPSLLRQPYFNSNTGLFSSLVGSDEKPSSSPLNFYAPRVLNKIIEDEADRSPNGNYIFTHVMMPHGPVTQDENCSSSLSRAEKQTLTKRYKNKKTPLGEVLLREIKTNSRYGSAHKFLSMTCATNLMVRFIDKLKSLNRFESSTIILHSDHGGPDQFSFLPRKNYSYQKKFAEKFKKVNIRATKLKDFDALSRALLLIKPPGISSEKKFNISTKLTQLSDIPDTLRSLNNFPVSSYDGKPIFSPNFDKSRSIHVFQGIYYTGSNGKETTFLGSEIKSSELNHFTFSDKLGWKVEKNIPIYQ